MIELLEWTQERGSHTAHILGAKYLIQPDAVGNRVRYRALLVNLPGRLIHLGYHPHVAAAKVECQSHYNRRTRWDEDIEAGAIG
jgi:hypothetical protein